MVKNGIDVSYHNGRIDWKKIKKDIDFAMIRIGYGRRHYDTEFDNNAFSCEVNSIPYGGYWFSYALNEKMAIDEANACCDALAEHTPLYPIAFDFEYGSDSYAKKQGVNITNNLRVKMARAFLKTVEDRGFYPILYTNEDYIRNKGFSQLLGEYDIWYARYNSNETPNRECEIWQYGKADVGYLKQVDVNHCYKDYPSIINPYYNTHDLDDVMINLIIQKSDLFYLTRDYINLACDIIDGKYGAGIERKRMIEELGFDYDIAQSVVNTIMRLKNFKD